MKPVIYYLHKYIKVHLKFQFFQILRFMMQSDSQFIKNLQIIRIKSVKERWDRMAHFDEGVTLERERAEIVRKRKKSPSLKTGAR